MMIQSGFAAIETKKTIVPSQKPLNMDEVAGSYAKSGGDGDFAPAARQPRKRRNQ